jgi:hypothetical protein
MRVYWMRYVNVLKSKLESVSILLLVGSYSFPIQYPRKSTIKSSFRKSPKLLAACLELNESRFTVTSRTLLLPARRIRQVQYHAADNEECRR